ncbi:ERCC4 domain-containing protein [Nanoarchaeota archaeon]
MKILIDYREKNSLVIAELAELETPYEIKHLKLADYIIGKDIGIERKTIGDFVGSMINKRLVHQLKDLKKNFKKPLLLVEGIAEEDIYKPSSHPKINENAVRGMLTSVALDLEVPMIFTDDSQDTAKYLHLLLRRMNKPQKEFSLTITRKAHSLKERQQIIIEGFPSVGPNLAKNLLKHFKSINAIMNADIRELTKVPKVGKKKAEIIKRIIDTKYH